ncbi:MAG: MBL fold metallo-hydrolase [Candidatus Thorarchaeota archaeon]|jgi:glyoxylase-like metal-dependent hydrolase (beta-lactamase superfamily II)
MIEIVPYDDIVTCIKTGTEIDGSVVMWAYSYLIGDTLFDAGCPNAIEEFMEFVSSHPVKHVYVSHAHEDHSGGCSALAEKATIYATPPVSSALKDPEVLSDFFVMVWGQPEPVKVIAPMPDHFRVGDLNFEVISLPGHNKDMVGFYERERGWLFSADAVPVPSRKRLSMSDENIPQTIATLEKIQALNLNVLFDSHRGPVENPLEHIQTRIDHLKDLQMKVKELHAKGRSISEIQDDLQLEGPWYLEMTKDRFGIEFVIRSLILDDKSESR